MNSSGPDKDWRGATQAALARATRARRRLQITLPIAAAAFAAVMCAGPLGVTAPGTIGWFEGLACPRGQHLEVREELDIEVTPAETRQVVYCVDAEGQGTLAGARPFVAMWVAYFGVFLVVAFGAVALGRGLGRWWLGQPKQPLGWEGEQAARALLAAGKRGEAVRLVRSKTGAGLRWARQYVAVMAGRADIPRR